MLKISKPCKTFLSPRLLLLNLKIQKDKIFKDAKIFVGGKNLGKIKTLKDNRM